MDKGKSKNNRKKEEDLPVEIDYSGIENQQEPEPEPEPEPQPELLQAVPEPQQSQPQIESTPEDAAVADLGAVDIIYEKKDTPNQQYVKFLKEYARSPNTPYSSIANLMGIVPSTASGYIKRFAHTMMLLRDDKDQIQKVRMAINNLVADKPELAMSETDIQALEPQAFRFSSKKAVSAYNQTDFTNSAKKLENPSSPNSDQSQRTLSPQEIDKLDQFKRYKENYSRINNSSRSFIMKFVLDNSPWVHYTQIDAFMTMFELREQNLMRSPQDMLKFCQDTLGPKVGQNIFQAFSELVTEHLPPDQQFGNSPWHAMGQGRAMGPNMGGFGGAGPSMQMGGSDPYSQNVNAMYNGAYYYEQGIVPPYLPLDHPDARRMIWEHEAEKRKEMKKEKERKDWQEQIKDFMNMKMMDIVDPAKQRPGMMGGNGMMPQDMNGMVMSGLVRAVPSNDEKGNFIWKYERATADPNSQSNPVNQMDSVVKMFGTMLEAMKALRPATENAGDTITNTLIRSFAEKLPSVLNPFEAAVQYKKLTESLTTPTNPQSGIEQGKLELAKTKMQQDYDFAKSAQAREDKRLELEIARQDKAEERSTDMMKNLFGSIGRIGEKAFMPLLMMFMGSKFGGAGGGPNIMSMLGPLMGMMGEGAGAGAGAGGGGDLMGMIQGLLGGGGAGGGALGGLSSILGGAGGPTPAGGGPTATIRPPPPRNDFSFPESESTYASQYQAERRAKFEPRPSDMYGYHPNPQASTPCRLFTTGRTAKSRTNAILVR